MRKFIKFILLLCLCPLLCLLAYYFYPEKTLPRHCHIDKIVVLKSKRQMMVYEKGNILKTYKISLGYRPIGDKKYEGDSRTPEGCYIIYGKNPNSLCHKNLGISYPNENDIKEAKAMGRNPGGNIKIHGLLNGRGYLRKFHRWKDWTNGCIGVTDNEIDDLYCHVLIRARIEILP